MKSTGSAFKGWNLIPKAGAAPVDAFRWSRTGGPQIAVTYQGTYDTLLNIGADLSATFDEIEISRKGGKGAFFIMTARQNGEEIIETHERIPSQENVSLLLSPVLIDKFAQLGGATDDQIKQALAVIKANVNKITDQTTYDQALTAGIDACTLIGLPGADALVAQVIKRLQLGTEFYRVPTYTYRHTYTMADRLFSADLIGSLDLDVGKVFTTEQLYIAENVPGDFPLPSGEWLKDGPSAQLQVGQKRQVAVTYTWAELWDRLTYEEASA